MRDLISLLRSETGTFREKKKIIESHHHLLVVISTVQSVLVHLSRVVFTAFFQRLFKMFIPNVTPYNSDTLYLIVFILTKFKIVGRRHVALTYVCSFSCGKQLTLQLHRPPSIHC